MMLELIKDRLQMNRVHSTFDQNFDFKIKREHQKKSYERRAYKLVDIRSIF